MPNRKRIFQPLRELMKRRNMVSELRRLIEREQSGTVLLGETIISYH